MIRRFLVIALLLIGATVSHAQPSLPSSFQAKTIHSPEAADIFVRWGGNGPVVAATATLVLVNSGRLSLDESPNSYLKSWKLPYNEYQAHEKVTLRRILSHSSGLSVGGFAGYRTGEAIPTLLQILNGEKPANNPPVRVDFIPGSMFRYSGGGAEVMQQLLMD